MVAGSRLAAIGDHCSGRDAGDEFHNEMVDLLHTGLFKETRRDAHHDGEHRNNRQQGRVGQGRSPDWTTVPIKTLPNQYAKRTEFVQARPLRLRMQGALVP